LYLSQTKVISQSTLVARLIYSETAKHEPQQPLPRTFSLLLL
jgi:hypothetical protein